MSAANQIQITGNLTRDPELRFTKSGKAVCQIGVAVNRSYKVGDDWEQEVSYFDVIVWNDLGENVAESVAKGDRVTVVGRMDQRSWETDEGEKRYKFEVTADDVAVSLRYATASLTKVEKEDGDKKSGGGSKRSKRQTPADEFTYDEEPF